MIFFFYYFFFTLLKMSLNSNFPAIAVRSVPTHDITAKYQHTKMLSNSSLVSQYGPTGDKMTLVNKTSNHTWENQVTA